jgi:hypothetical protein
VYVLDPKMQARKKLPRLETRSKQGMFMGLSRQYSSEVPWVINLTTGSITTQYHVVFDDLFKAVCSVDKGTEPPDHWEDLWLDNSTQIRLDDPPELLDDEWLTRKELDEKRRELDRQEIRLTSNRETKDARVNHVPPLARSNGELEEARDATTPRLPTLPPATLDPLTATVKTEGELPSEEEISRESTRPEGVPVPNPIGARRSTRTTARKNQTSRYIDVFMSKVDTFAKDEGHDANVAYLEELHTDQDTGDVDISNPRVYAAKRRSDPDTPTAFYEAMKGEHVEEYLAAMKSEIKGIISQRAWETTPRSTAAKVIKSTWVFKLKRLPDGTPSKFKTRFCVLGDLQTEGVDYFEIYAPVVQWSTVCMVLNMVLREGWATRQVEYTNAFAQAEMGDVVHVEPPKLFGPISGKDLVLRFLKSLYGLKQAPRTFYEKLQEGLLERRFVQSEVDHCLFMKDGCICFIYVDDTIYAGPDAEKLATEITSPGGNGDEHQHSFQLRDEGEVGDFLGVSIEKQSEGTFLLTQTGFIERTLNAGGMSDAHRVCMLNYSHSRNPPCAPARTHGQIQAPREPPN